ncbi:flagellar hook-length control protein FliK [Clostridium sp. AF27-2AA]|uniref:flagellar hook-length control protein FliK n=1 Tax=Clostridium sp. AF27-2AA TaxID=2292206 RepID=UPI0015FBD356|nr:flagellar hook-length control protein FliK [Clostridium sp. AF27-2AA]
MNRIENAGQVKTGYSVKSGTNSEEKVGNGSDFASMLTKYKKRAAQDDETKKAETGETKNKETQPEETKNRENEKQVNGRQSGENEKTDEIKAEIKVTDIQDEKNSQDGEKEQELAAAYASETCYRTFVQITAENSKTPAVYNNEINGIQDLAVQTTSEAGMEDQSAAVSTIQKTEAPHTETAVHADGLKLQNRLEQTGETEDTGRTGEAGQSKQTAKMNREEEMPDRKEHISGKEMTALASPGYTGTVESSAGTAAKPAAVDTGPADRLTTAQDTLTEDLGNYLDTKISEKKGKLELSLEPERLGKLTIRLEYEKGKTEVTIFSTSAKTLEILSKEAGHLAQILEEKTGTPTVIYTPEQTENRQNMDQDTGHGRNGRQGPKEQRQKQDDSFAQQLRLGLA